MIEHYAKYTCAHGFYLIHANIYLLLMKACMHFDLCM